jgi:hypothetical protein
MSQVQRRQGEENIVQKKQQRVAVANAWGQLLSLEEKGSKRLTQVK